jgi:hypothetical protein
MPRSCIAVQVFVLALLASAPAMAQPTTGRPTGLFHHVQCEGIYPKHLQGICTDEKESIFWCFTDVLVKTNRDGRVIKKIPVAFHHGDLCYHDGKVYVAVNLGKFNELSGKTANSWVYVYDAANLSELARHKVPEVVFGAGGMGYHDGRFIVIGGLPPGVEENYAYEYDDNFSFIKRHVINSGYTLMGIQTAKHSGGCWWFGCYGKPAVLFKTDESFKLVGKVNFDCALGIVGLADGSFLVARGESLVGKKYTASLFVADVDAEKGLVIREGQQQ